MKNCRVKAFGSDNCCEDFTMNELAKLAERIRAIHARESEFLGRFAAESLFDRPMFLDGVLADLEQNGGVPPSQSSRESAFGLRDRQR